MYNNHHLPESISHETFASSTATTLSEETHQAMRVKLTSQSEPRSAAHQRTISAALTFLVFLLLQQIPLLPTTSISDSVLLSLVPALFCTHAGTQGGGVLLKHHYYCRKGENFRGSIKKWAIRGLLQLWNKTGRAKIESIICLLKLLLILVPFSF